MNDKRSGLAIEGVTFHASVLAAYVVTGLICLGAGRIVTPFAVMHLFISSICVLRLLANWHSVSLGAADWLGGLLTPIAGPFGALVGLTVAVGTGIGAAQEDPARWLEALVSPTAASEPEKLCRRLRAERAARQAFHGVKHLPMAGRSVSPQVVPFCDVMRWGTLAEKQRVLSLIVRNFSPEFVPALRMGLNDDTNLVRVQAASAMSTLDARFLEKELRLSAKVAESPDDFAAMLALSSHRCERAASGLLDSLAASEELIKAREGYEKCREMKPFDPLVMSGLVEVLLRLGETDAAGRALECCGCRNILPPIRAAELNRQFLFKRGRYSPLSRVERGIPVMADCSECEMRFERTDAVAEVA